jgi:hypothetical protein
LIHVVTCVAGLWLLFLVLRSMIRVALMNRHYEDPFAQLTGHTVYGVVAWRLHGKRDYKSAHPVLLWFFPAYILLLIVVYFLGSMIAFALLYWGTRAVPGWHAAFIASGSGLNTLGFATPSTNIGQWIAIPEGALGLGIVVFLFTFIPGYQTVIRSREDKTAWLYGRIGDDPTGLGLLEWCQRAGVVGEMNGMWESWESWFRMLRDTHSVLPMLSMSPSVQSGQSWIVAAAAVLDAAALTASTLDAPSQEAARVCAQTGTRALRAIAEALGYQAAGSSRTGVSRDVYDAACARLAAAGMRVKVDCSASCAEFVAWRAQYEDVLVYLCRRTFSPLDSTFFHV